MAIIVKSLGSGIIQNLPNFQNQDPNRTLPEIYAVPAGRAAVITNIRLLQFGWAERKLTMSIIVMEAGVSRQRFIQRPQRIIEPFVPMVIKLGLTLAAESSLRAGVDMVAGGDGALNIFSFPISFGIHYVISGFERESI